MPISTVLLASGTDAVDRSSYTTNPITPEPYQLVVAVVLNVKTTPTPEIPVLTGNGLTWVQVVTVLHSTISTPTRRLTLYRAMGAAPTSGPVTIDLNVITHDACAYAICQSVLVDVSGADGAGAVVQSATAVSDSTSGTSLTVTLGAFGDAGNATLGAFAHVVAEGCTPGAGFTELVDVVIPNSPSLMVEWREDNDTTVDASWATGARSAGVAIEIKAAPVHTLKLVKDGVTIKIVNTEIDGVNPGDAWDPIQDLEDQLQLERDSLIDKGAHKGYA